MAKISIKMPEPMLHKIAQEAKARRVGKSEFIRGCVERELRHDKKAKKKVSCLDLMGESVGSFRGSRDLSTNRKYLIESA